MGEREWVGQIIHGSALEVLRQMPDNFVDSMVTDPPAGISFMGEKWDSKRGGRRQWVSWLSEIFVECRRVLKPGAHILVWALPQKAHWTMCAIEDAGFEIITNVHHIFGSGLPKGINVSKAIDKHLKAERLVVGRDRYYSPGRKVSFGDGITYNAGKSDEQSAFETIPATPEAQMWEGWHSQLKSAVEYWVLARKPLAEKTIVRQVLATGTGALNIDACRVEAHDRQLAEKFASVRNAPPRGNHIYGQDLTPRSEGNLEPHPQGRFPAHLVLSHGSECTYVGTKQVKATRGNYPFTQEGATTVQDYGTYGHRSEVSHTDEHHMEIVDAYECSPDCPIALLDQQSGYSVSTGGGASRFFTNLPYEEDSLIGYYSKASTKDRTRGGEENHHPTAKSTHLMAWLCTLVTPPNGIVLDCFAGSGSTLVACVRKGFQCIGIEQDEEYVRIARAGIEDEKRKG